MAGAIPKNLGLGRRRGGELARIGGGAVVTTRAELRALLRDALTLWSVEASIEIRDDAIVLTTASGPFTVQPADPDVRPVRWFLQTPEREAAGRPPRAVPSIVALLSALRNHIGGEGGDRARIAATGGA